MADRKLQGHGQHAHARCRGNFYTKLAPITVAPRTKTSGSTALLTYNKQDRNSFEAIADQHPDVVIPLEQTPDWIDFETAVGRRPLGIWAYRDGDGHLVATASFVHVTRRFRESVVVVNGPVWFAPRTPDAE